MYKVNKNKNCYKAWRCDGKCPKNCVCPWIEEEKRAAIEAAFMYYSSQQNQLEDPDGYKEFLEDVKAGLYD